MMVLVGRWWNGLWGRLARRDIWLIRETQWQVRAREGDSESGRELRWRYHSEQEARAMVDRLMSTGPGAWRDLTDLTTRPPPGRPGAAGDDHPS